MKVWLDDVRPAPPGWTLAKAVHDVIWLLENSDVEDLSLDHDLGNKASYCGGACPYCGLGPDECQDLLPTGYDLCKWMAEHECWPKNRPTVHSANVRGREDMLSYIDRYYPPGD